MVYIMAKKYTAKKYTAKEIRIIKDTIADHLVESNPGFFNVSITKMNMLKNGQVSAIIKLHDLETGVTTNQGRVYFSHDIAFKRLEPGCSG